MLIAGCGDGFDAFQFAKVGADVYAFDLTLEMLALAEVSGNKEGFDVKISLPPAEKRTYQDNFFDAVFVRDILHHVENPKCLRELRRVSKDGALLLASEVYSHSWIDLIKRSRIVHGYMYSKMQRLVYGGEKPYITEDERKLTESDIQELKTSLAKVIGEKHFNFIVTRLIDDKHTVLSKLDRLLLVLLKPISPFLGGRVVLYGMMKK